MSKFETIITVIFTATMLVSMGIMFAGVVHVLPPVVGMLGGVSMLTHIIAIGYLMRDDF